MPVSFLDPALIGFIVIALYVCLDGLYRQAKRQDAREREQRELAMIARRYESRGGEMPAPER